MTDDKFDKMHELSGSLAHAAEMVCRCNALNLGAYLEKLDIARKAYNKEVFRLACNTGNMEE